MMPPVNVVSSTVFSEVKRTDSRRKSDMTLMSPPEEQALVTAAKLNSGLAIDRRIALEIIMLGHRV
jgi:hypothetical protein